MKQLSKKTKSRYLATALLIDVMFFGLTSPAKVPSILLVAGFMMLVATFYLGFSLTVDALVARSEDALNRRKYTVAIATVLVAFLIAMQSIGQLSGRDVLAVIPLAVLFFIYFSYSPKRN